MSLARVPLFAPTRVSFSVLETRRFALLALASALFLASNRAEAQQSATGVPQLYSHGDPTTDEQYLLTLLNRARMDPVGEGERIKAWLMGTVDGGEVIAQFGTDPNQVAAAIAALPAVPPVAFNADLIASARAHSNDLAPHDGDGPNGSNHNGYDGSTPQSRVDATGYTGLPGSSVGYGGYLGENFDPG